MYICLQQPSYSLMDSDAVLVSLRYEDKEVIRKWRNEQTSILRQNSFLSEEQQTTYFDTVIVPQFQQFQPPQILFSIIQQARCIGYAGLTYINWQSKRAEISFLLDSAISEDSDKFQLLFRSFLYAIQHIAVAELGLHKLIAETYEYRKHVRWSLNKARFLVEGVLQDHVYKDGKWHSSFIYAFIAKNPAILPLQPAKGVLLTSISKKVPLIQAVKTAYKKVDTFSKVYGCDSDLHCLGQYFVDHFWHCPKLGKLSIEHVIDFCQTNYIGSIIPTSDADCLFFSQYIDKCTSYHINIMTSDHTAIKLCQDKKLFSDRLLEHGFPAIASYLNLTSDVAASCVVKERFGASYQKILLNISHHDAKQFATSCSHPIFQPFISGTEYSVDIYKDSTGATKGSVVRERNRLFQGEACITTTVERSDIQLLIENCATLLQLRGHAIFQIIESPQKELFIIECNPRFGGASTASLAVGLDSFYWFFLETHGKVLDQYPFMRLSGNIRQIQYTTNLVLAWS